MKKLVRRVVVGALAVAVIGPSFALAGHAPHYPKKDHPALRHAKAQHVANKKARAMRAR